MKMKLEHWRERALHARIVAEFMTDPDCKPHMVEIARRYEQIAAKLEGRQKRGIVIWLSRARGNLQAPRPMIDRASSTE